MRVEEVTNENVTKVVTRIIREVGANAERDNETTTQDLAKPRSQIDVDAKLAQ